VDNILRDSIVAIENGKEKQLELAVENLRGVNDYFRQISLSVRDRPSFQRILARNYRLLNQASLEKSLKLGDKQQQERIRIAFAELKGLVMQMCFSCSDVG
jgi:hypothetical protein